MMDSIEFLKQYVINGSEDCGEPDCDDCKFTRGIRASIKEIKRLRRQVELLNQSRIHPTT